MSYNGSVFLPTQNVVIVSTDAELQALPSSSSIVGFPYLSIQSGLYYFSNSVVNIGTTDLVANDNGGTYKLYNPQSFLFLDSDNQISSLNFNPNVIPLTSGNILQGNSSNQAESVTISGAIELAPGGITSIPLNYGDILQGNSSNEAEAVSITGIVSLAPGGITSIPLNSGNILQGNNSNEAEGVTISGAISLAEGGVVSIPLTSGNILQGNSSNIAEETTISGVITLAANGVTSITNGSITSAALNSGIAYTSRVIAQGAFTITPTGSPLTATINVSGILITDFVNIIISDAQFGVPPYLFQAYIISNGGVIEVYFDSSNNPGTVTGYYNVSRLISA